MYGDDMQVAYKETILRIILNLLNIYGSDSITIPLQILAAIMPVLCLIIPKRYGKSSLALFVIWMFLVALTRPSVVADSYINLLKSFMGWVVLYAMMIIYQCMSFDAHQAVFGYMVADFDRMERFGSADRTKKASTLTSRFTAVNSVRLLQ